jgi:hypothetical protein
MILRNAFSAAIMGKLRQLRAFSGRFSSDAETADYEQEFRLPIPSRYVVDKQGIIRAADVKADYNSSGAFGNSQAVADVNRVIGQH